jgi:GR25 family glycosyltransferase involved in LPS biosynthesis
LVVLTILVVLGIIFNKSSFNDTCLNVKIQKCFVLTTSTSSIRYRLFKNSYDLDIPLETIIGVNTKIPENAEQFRDLVVPEKYDAMYLMDKGEMERKNSSYFNSGALGCYMGHMEFYKRCFQQNLKYALIFEDNVILTGKFKEELENLVLPSDFDICFLHSWGSSGDKIEKCGKDLKRLKMVMGTKCYIINVRNMQKYFPLFFPIETHVDFATEKLIYNGANVYLCNFDSLNVVYLDNGIGHSQVKKKQDLSPYFKIDMNTL